MRPPRSYAAEAGPMLGQAVSRRTPRDRWLKIWIAVVLTLLLFVALEGALLHAGSRGTPSPPRRTDTTLRH